MKRNITESQIHQLVESTLFWLSRIMEIVEDMLNDGYAEDEVIDYLVDTLHCSPSEAENLVSEIVYEMEDHIDEGVKRNPPKNEIAAINKANREDDIKNHGKSIAFRTTKTKNPKAYNRQKSKRTTE